MKTITYIIAVSAIVVLGACGSKKDNAEANQTHDAMASMETATAENVGHAMVMLPTIQCNNCKEAIETGLVKTAGIISVNVDVEGKLGHVNFDSEKLSAMDVDMAIAMLGYQANKMKADPEAYAALPACCKVTE